MLSVLKEHGKKPLVCHPPPDKAIRLSCCSVLGRQFAKLGKTSIFFNQLLPQKPASVLGTLVKLSWANAISQC